ncbi:type IV secretion system protein VirB3 [Luteibacter sp. UNC138MFCol5.1]|uniref:type IV secretion system protein VirB3 n=1 Tax=Luteibacter sp. UNC138MFCol5.1 TaxID=1502774 RepID=UPI0008B80D38|nr:VirB3 family type IV secretion system protein [Luteibacter sp. UNC138MFCol5.1]SEO82079.1 type IV secretion system protein VirB3 [Luteibacter sp. UNC138MFCol5.1]
MRKDALFRGCTRPPMFMGVPYIPFFLGAGTCLLLAMYFNFWLLLLMPPVILAMRQMARRDEMIFRLLALRLSFRTRVRNVSAHDGAWAFTPNAYRDAARTQRR